MSPNLYNKQKDHLTEEEMMYMIDNFLNSKKTYAFYSKGLKHIASCDSCFQEIQQLLLDTTALEQTMDFLEEKSALQNRETDQPFEFFLGQFKNGFELIKSNLSNVFSIPMPGFRDSRLDSQDKRALEKLKFVNFIGLHPVRLSIESTISGSWIFQWQGLPSSLKKISLLLESAKDEHQIPVILSEILISGSAAMIELKGQQLFDKNNTLAMIQFYYNNSLSGIIEIKKNVK